MRRSVLRPSLAFTIACASLAWASIAGMTVGCVGNRASFPGLSAPTSSHVEASPAEGFPGETFEEGASPGDREGSPDVTAADRSWTTDGDPQGDRQAADGRGPGTPVRTVSHRGDSSDVVSWSDQGVSWSDQGVVQEAARSQRHSLTRLQDGDEPRGEPEVDDAPGEITQGLEELEPTAEGLRMNLPTALALVGGQHPIVGIARWRVQEAYAELSQAQALWLPSLRAGVGFHRHDGTIQASDGTIVDINRNSFQYGLGVGATAAGTTMMPGLLAQFHLAEAIFEPEVARKTAWARGHAARGVVNEQLRDVAIAYNRLLRAHQDRRILQESRDRIAGLYRLTSDFAEAGQGLAADADRLRTELDLADSRVARGEEQVGVASARLAQAMSIESGRPILPMDPTVVPLLLVSPQADPPSLIRTGLVGRPELKESQALVAAAYDAYRQQRIKPFIPSVLLGFSTGGFGGGLGNRPRDIDGRYDFDAVVSWEVRNLGFGEQAQRRRANARVQQAQYEKLRVMDQVAREVTEAHAQVGSRAEQIRIMRRAIASAEDSYRRNLERIREGQGLPLEALQSVQALEETWRGYLAAVVDHNEAQFRLAWALGFSVDTLSVSAEGTAD